MEPRKLLETLAVADRLKSTTRHCVLEDGRRESVAEHCWRAALMAYFLRDEFPEADMDKVIKMLLIHDLGESFTGDIPSFRKTKENEATEEKLLYDWVAALPQPYAEEMRALYEEMAARETVEAKIYKAIDNFEAVIQHNESPLETWVPEEYELNRTYGWDKAEFSSYLTALRQEMLEDTEKKIAEGKKAAQPNDRGYRIIPYEEKYRDDMICMVLEAKDAIGRPPHLNDDLLDIRGCYLDKGDMFWLVIDENDRVIGCGGYTSLPGGEAKLRRLYIKADKKRQGIGTALLETAEKYLRRQGKTAVQIHLGGREYFESHCFYPKHGYTEFAPDYMRKEL